MAYNYLKEAGKKNFVRAIMIRRNGQIKRITAFYNSQGVFQWKNGAYVIYSDRIFYEKNKPYCFFYEHYSPALYLDPNDLKMKINAENLKDILNTKVIKEMVSNKGEKVILYVLMGINILFTIFILVKQWGLINTTGG